MNNIIKRTWNQNRMVNIEALSGMAFQAEDGGHTFEISGINDANEAVSLSGTVAGVFMRPDGTDVALTGTASDGVVSVILSDACYAVAGRFGLTIFVTADSKTTCVYACVGTVAQTSYGTVAGDTPANVADLVNAINAAIASIPADYSDLMTAIAPTYSNTALYAVGSYAWYDGKLYRCISAITTAESWTAAHWEVAVIGSDIKYVRDDLPIVTIPVSLVRENGYRKADGTIFGTTTQYFHSTFDAQKGDIIVLDYVEVATSVSVFGYFIDGTYVSIKTGDGGTAVKHLESAPLPADCVVSISGRGADFDNTSVQIVRANEYIVKQIVNVAKPMLDADETIQWQYALDSVLCIGDSLTKGVPANTTTMPNPMKQNYPFYLSRMIDAECTNAGVPGIKTSEWYLEQYSNYTMTDYNAIVIFLGTNGQLTDTLDTDVDPYDDYNDYAATETGYYCKLIEHILSDNSNVIIVLVNVWRVNTGGNTARTVISKIGQKYSLPVVDTYDLRYDVNPAYHGGSNNVHMAKAGYLALANRILHTLRLYLSEHVSIVNKGMTR